MVYCAAFQCKSRVERKEPGITFHRFPKCEETRKQWIKNLQIKDWSPAAHHRLCSKHFEERYFYSTEQKTKLLSEAVPTIFDELPKSSQTRPARKLSRVSKTTVDPNVSSTARQSDVAYVSLETAQQDTPSTSSFPLKNEKILDLWVRAVGRKNFKPSKHAKLCSDHFKESDYLIRPGAYIRRLKPDAVPSIFPKLPTPSQAKIPKSGKPAKILKSGKPAKIPKSRKPRKRRADEHVSDDNQLENANLSPRLRVKIPKLQANDERYEQVTNITLTEGEPAIDPLAIPAIMPTENVYIIMDQSTGGGQVKPRKQEIHSSNKKLNNLKEVIQQLRNNNLLSEEKGNTLYHLFEGANLEIFQNQPKKTIGTGYSEELKNFSLTLNCYSSEAYRYCRTMFDLPHPASMRTWTSSVNAEPGFLKEVLLALQSFPLQDKDCTLILDSICIRKQIIWEPKSMKFIGYCDYGNELEIEDPETPASEALVFMLCSLKGKWKWPIGYVFRNKLDASTQAELIRTALILASDADLRVWGITCEGTLTNFNTMEILGCKLFVDYHDEMKCSFKHPCRDYDVHFVPDACHMLKLARNALGTCKYFEIETNKIEWVYIETLRSLQNLKLSFEHAEWEANKRKARTAVQTLSSPVADVLEFLMNQDIVDFENCEDTITFIRIIGRIFDFLNVSNPFGKGFKKPLRLKDIPFLERHLVPLIEYLFKLNHNGQPLIKSSRKAFIFGLSASIKSVISIARALLTDNSNFKYLLTYRFSLDHIEPIFTKIRRPFGCNSDPNQIQFKTAMKRLVLKNSISSSPSANCIALDDDALGSMFGFKWNRRKSPLHAMFDGKAEEFLESLESKDFSDLNVCALETKREIEDLKGNIIYYVAGYVVNKIINEIYCESCVKALSPAVDEYTYCYLGFNNRGELAKVSKSVFLLIQEADKQFRFHTNSFKEVGFSENLIKTIIADCYRKFSLDDQIFSNLNCPNVPIEARPHKLSLILTVTKMYLKMRFFCQFSFRSFSNPISRRKEFSKSFLFSNC